MASRACEAGEGLLYLTFEKVGKKRLRGTNGEFYEGKWAKMSLNRVVLLYLKGCFTLPEPILWQNGVEWKITNNLSITLFCLRSYKLHFKVILGFDLVAKSHPRLL